MKTVTIKYLYGNHDDLVSRHKAASDREAIARAVQKHFGPGHFFREEHDLSGIGQIGHNVGGVISFDTLRVRVDVS